PIKYVLEFPEIFNYQVKEILTIAAAGKWYFADCTLETPGLKVASSSSPNGPVFKSSASGIITGDSNEMNQLAGEMDFEKYILLVVDHEGNRRLVGDLENPVALTINFELPPRVSGRKEYQLSFTHSGAVRPPYYLVPFVSDPNEEVLLTGISI